MLFTGNLAPQLVVIALFLFENLVTPFLEMSKALFQTTRDAAIKPDSRPADIFQKAPVMRDENNGRANLAKLAFQPFDCRKIEMVGRLVQ